MENFFNQFFENIGEDKNREGLKETPKSAAYLFSAEMFSTHPSIKNRIQSLSRRVI
ncbi:hypothetical protein VN0484_13870 [Helicobacter pylori]|nr:hypothetical protein VN0484_13870 [Helicobacter pylori]